MNDNFKEVLQELLNAEAKRSVFASFSDLRDIPSITMDDSEEKLRYENAVKKMQSNPVFKAAKAGGVSMLQFKEMKMTALSSAAIELTQKLSKVIDLAIVDKK